jgi:hypothetical protein
MTSHCLKPGFVFRKTVFKQSLLRASSNSVVNPMIFTKFIYNTT